MDCSTLISTCLGLFILVIGGCAAAANQVQDRVQCYQCTYYKGEMEINPQCNDIDPAKSEDVPTRTDCVFCKKQVLKYENETRIVIKRQCDRFCTHMGPVDLTYKDVSGTAVEYCCQEDLCNVGDDAISYRSGSSLVLLLSGLLSLLFCIQ